MTSLVDRLIHRRRHREPRRAPPPPIWLENEHTIYQLAQRELDWIQGVSHSRFWHPEGKHFVNAWPLRILWSLWWAPGVPAPRTPAELKAILEAHPPKDPASWAVGALVDPAMKTRKTARNPWLVPDTPVLPAGTHFVAGRSQLDYCDGFDSQLITVDSGPWAGTLLDLRIGRAGEPYLIARLGLMSPEDAILADPARTAALLERLRSVERHNPSMPESV